MYEPVAVRDVEMASGNSTTTAASSVCIEAGTTTASSVCIEDGEPTKLFQFLLNAKFKIVASLVFGILAVLFYFNNFAGTTDWGVPIHVGCYSNVWSPADCGILGAYCRPFVDLEWTVIRCPPRCTWSDGAMFPVIGTGPYRADSRLCASAVHSGLVSARGGCAAFRAAGASLSYAGGISHGASAYPSAQWFPKSLEFRTPPGSHYCGHIGEVIFSFIAVVFAVICFLRPDPSFIWWSLLFVGYFYAALVTTEEEPWQVLLRSTERLFYIAGFGLPMYLSVSRFTLLHISSMRLLLAFVLPYLSALNWNFLTAVVADIDVTPEIFSVSETKGLVTIFGVGLLVLMCEVYHLRMLYLAGLLRTFFVYYAAAIIALISISLIFINHFSFHLHHSFIPLFMWPHLRFSSSPSLVAQGVFLGMFVSGVATWGWSPQWEILAPGSSASSPYSPRELWVNASTSDNILGSFRSTSELPSRKDNRRALQLGGNLTGAAAHDDCFWAAVTTLGLNVSEVASEVVANVWSSPLGLGSTTVLAAVEALQFSWSRGNASDPQDAADELAVGSVLEMNHVEVYAGVADSVTISVRSLLPAAGPWSTMQSVAAGATAICVNGTFTFYARYFSEYGGRSEASPRVRVTFVLPVTPGGGGEGGSSLLDPADILVVKTSQAGKL